jgi:hypothetical protein
MMGCDFYSEELARWQAFASHLRAQQIARILRACQVQLSLQPEFPIDAPLIGAGIGRFLVRELAGLLERDYVDFSACCPEVSGESALSTADCAPAVAVACLLRVQT